MSPGQLFSWPQPHILETESGERGFIRAVYGWMFGGLLLTAAAAWWTVSSPAMRQLIFGTPAVFLVLLVAELALVFALSFGVMRMSPGAAAGIFLVYSLLNGLTLSGIAFAYARATVATAFVVAAVMFGAMSIVGMTTRRDLTSLGGLLSMALIGIIIASVLNLFLRSSNLNFAISIIGVIVFVGLTAWDTQKLKQLPAMAEGDATRLAVVGALTLYLDFINLFLMLLQLFGGRRRR
jgi:FtsH-binding integral membrane protein